MIVRKCIRLLVNVLPFAEKRNVVTISSVDAEEKIRSTVEFALKPFLEAVESGDEDRMFSEAERLARTRNVYYQFRSHSDSLDYDALGNECGDELWRFALGYGYDLNSLI